MKTPDSMKPKVYKARDRRYLVVIYNDHEEMYDFHSSTTFKEITKESGPGADEYTSYDSAEMCRNSGMNEIHFSEAMRAHGIVCTCKEYDDTIRMGSGGCKCKIADSTGKEIQDLDIDYIELNKKD